MNELALGIEARRPVVQVIEVAVLAVIEHIIPSIVTDKDVPKFVPVMVRTVPPTLGPNLGLNEVTVEVLA
jgi:hypothetical protein